MSTDKQHWAFLGFIRFVLASIVLTGHIRLDISQQDEWTYFGSWFSPGSAVYGFLILSGYSIAASLERSSRGFYLRRIVRIWPIYLLSIVLALAVTATIGGGIVFPSGRTFPPPTVLQVVASLLMLQSIVALAVPIDSQLWTLAVEWWLYMAAPLLKKLPTPLIALPAIFSLYTYITTIPGDPAALLYGRSLLLLAWFWLVGFMYYRHRHSAIGYMILFLPMIFACFFNIFLGKAVAVALFSLALSSYIRLSTALITIMNWLGDLSYPEYCLHGPLLALCVFYHIRSGLWICCIVLAVSAAALHFMDLPIRRRFRTDKHS